MVSRNVQHITPAGTIIDEIRSLVDLKSYTLRNIESLPIIPFGNSPKIIVIEGKIDYYRIDSETYKELRNQYYETELAMKQVDSLIDKIDKELSQSEDKYPTDIKRN